MAGEAKRPRFSENGSAYGAAQGNQRTSLRREDAIKLRKTVIW